MEEKSIFQTELSSESNGHILSASKWCRFLGIVMFIFSTFLAIMIIALSASSEARDGVKLAFATNPALAKFAELPNSIVLLIGLIGIGILLYLGILLINIAKNGIAYSSSHNELAFVNTFKAAKTYFLISVLTSIIGIIYTIATSF